MSDPDGEITREKRGHVLVLGINRPDKLNGFTPIDHGKRLTGALGKLDDVDLLNFGSDDRDTTITVGGGFRYRFTDNVQIGVGAETPITDNDDSILDYRLYADLVLSW